MRQEKRANQEPAYKIMIHDPNDHKATKPLREATADTYIEATDKAVDLIFELCTPTEQQLIGESNTKTRIETYGTKTRLFYEHTTTGAILFYEAWIERKEEAETKTLRKENANRNLENEIFDLAMQANETGNTGLAKRARAAQILINNAIDLIQ